MLSAAEVVSAVNHANDRGATGEPRGRPGCAPIMTRTQLTP
jgi:hypothetical protein